MEYWSAGVLEYWIGGGLRPREGSCVKIERLRLTYDLCSSHVLFELTDAQLMGTRAAQESEILRFHTPEYVEVLKDAKDKDNVPIIRQIV